MIQEQIHAKIMQHCQKVDAWFAERAGDLKFPFYSSYDIRDSGHKIAPVDANIFPAGFNNICPQDKEYSVDVARKYLQAHYGTVELHVGLLTEEHTSNLFYWENVASIKELLQEAGAVVELAFPKPLDSPLQITSSSGKPLTVYGAERTGDSVTINGKEPDLLISNNDFSESYADWAEGLTTPMNPPRELGWFRRTKEQFFAQYNELASEFAEVIGIDAIWLQVKTERFDHLDMNDPASLENLSRAVEKFMLELKQSYKAKGIEKEPFVFVKNNSGTYGLAVIPVHDPKEIIDWNYKSRKKMKAAKGGRQVSNVIIQEGIPTKYHKDIETSEPCIYVIGQELVGGFLRTHTQKDTEDNLNSPGAVFKRLCMSDMALSLADCPQETVYGWVSKLASLAVAKEAAAGQVQFRNYRL